LSKFIYSGGRRLAPKQRKSATFPIGAEIASPADQEGDRMRGVYVGGFIAATALLMVAILIVAAGA